MTTQEQRVNELTAQCEKQGNVIAELRKALSILTLEAKHFRHTGKGEQFLNDALREADLMLDNVPMRRS